MEVGEVSDVVDEHRAAIAARIRPARHIRREHEVVDDQLAAALEQIEQARFTAQPLEDVALVDPGHWQPSALCRQRASRPGGPLFPNEQPSPPCLPLPPSSTFPTFPFAPPRAD